MSQSPPSSVNPAHQFALERNLLVTIKPGFGPPRENLSQYRWRMWYSLPYPFPAKDCVKLTPTIAEKQFNVSIHNHYNRVIRNIRKEPDGPEYFHVDLEDKRKPAPTYANCVSFSREALHSVVIFDEQTDYPSGDAAFQGVEQRIQSCTEWLSAFLAACQRAAPYLSAWLVYPVSLFDVGTIYHEVNAYCSTHKKRESQASAVALSVGRQLQNPAFVMDVPSNLEAQSPMDSANELLAESLMSLYRGMPRLTVTNAYTAVEYLANAVFTSTRVASLMGYGVPQEKAEMMVDEVRTAHRTEPHYLLNKGIKEASGRSLMEEDKKLYDALLVVQKLRHRVAHRTQAFARRGA